jgi:hypothetical protein
VDNVLLLLFLGFVVCVGIALYLRKKRRDALMAKYGDAAIVEKIMNRMVWQGMSEEQLIDSWGRPVARDQKVYKSKVTVVFKYQQTSKKRFARRVTVENGIVVG